MKRRAIAAIGISVAALLYLAPVVWMVITSFKTRSQALAIPPILWFKPTLRNYEDAFVSGVIQGPLVSSLLVASVSAVVAILIAFPISYLVSRQKISWGNHIFFGFLATKMLPAAAVALPMYWIFGAVGLLDTYVALILANVVTNLTVALWLLRVVLDSIPAAVEESGVIDGLTTGAAVLRLVVPRAAPALGAVAVLIFATVWGEMAIGSIVAGFARRPLTVAILGFVTPHGTFWGRIAAVCVLSLVPAIACVSALNWWWRKE